MTSTITTQQYDALVQAIYQTLIMTCDEDGNERGLGEMGETRDAASDIVKSWVESEGINVI